MDLFLYDNTEIHTVLNFDNIIMIKEIPTQDSTLTQPLYTCKASCAERTSNIMNHSVLPLHYITNFSNK